VCRYNNALRVQIKNQETDRLQRVIGRLVAISPAGVNLLLIGGFRYRLLDNSQRFSMDIDYHWGGDLEAKQGELLALSLRGQAAPGFARSVEAEAGENGTPPRDGRSEVERPARKPGISRDGHSEGH
jgi:hypothetical protein